MREADLIDRATSDTWVHIPTRRLATEFGWLDQYESLARTSAAPRAPQHLLARAVAGYHAGVLGIQELARWFDRTPEELESELGQPAETSDDDDFWDDPFEQVDEE